MGRGKLVRVEVRLPAVVAAALIERARSQGVGMSRTAASLLAETLQLPPLPEQRTSRPTRRPSLHQLVTRRGRRTTSTSTSTSTSTDDPALT